MVVLLQFIREVGTRGGSGCMTHSGQAQPHTESMGDGSRAELLSPTVCFGLVVIVVGDRRLSAPQSKLTSEGQRARVFGGVTRSSTFSFECPLLLQYRYQ